MPEPEAPARAAADIALSANALRVRRGARDVLADVDFAARRGQVHAILGPNGAGKSTMLRALAGLLPYGGSVRLDGAEVSSLPPGQRARRMSFVPQRSQLAAALPVEVVVGQGRFAYGGGLGRMSEADRLRVEQAMAQAHVSALHGRSFTELSYGEQRRVLLARALATGADIMLLDEPTASLDIAHALQLHAELRSLAARGHCVVVVLHQLDDALRFVDAATLLSDGRLVASGPVDEVLSREHIERIYGVTPRPGEGTAFEALGPNK